ncbi:MAG: ATP-binding cassette domain-containing protein [Quinella sp. 3Q1]|nr:ATP-binding cassette domain-containing protein [Quinella sp. 3Q1]
MISVKDVSYTYMTGTPFEKTALKNISFDVADGEVLAIAGHTGSGKSTPCPPPKTTSSTNF